MGEHFEADFRKAMRRLASAVTVISTTHENRRHGMTATAVTSVSSNPPSLLACINRSASLHAPLIASGHFCINILHGSQSEIADAFGGSRSGDDRFAAGRWATHDNGLPYLWDAQASIFCAADLVTSYGTHSIVIGKISEVIVGGHVAPLLYQDGRYTVGLGDGIDWVVPI
jgi:flavin reductase